MAKKSVKKLTKQPAPAAAPRPSNNVPPTGQTAAGSSSLAHPAHASAAKPPPAMPVVRPAPPAPVEAKPTPAPPPAQPLRETPAKAAAPPAPPAFVPLSTAMPAPAPAARPPAPPVAVKPPAAKPVVADTPRPPAGPRKVTVTFTLLEPDAKRAAVSGDFNEWSPAGAPMRRHEGGHWETTLELAPGRYQYKFIVDGEWIPDPLARENIQNPHGTLNSVIEVRG